MAVVGAAIAAASAAFSASAVGAFLTTNIFGRVLFTLGLSALRAALVGKPDVGPEPGIRTTQTQTGGINPASFILGRYATEGVLIAPPMSHGTVGGVPNAYLNYVIELADIPGHTLETLYIDGEKVTLGTTEHASYGRPVQGRFSGYAWIKYYDGTQTVADPMLRAKYGGRAVRPWSSDMIGKGICYAILTFRFNRKIYSGFPSVRFALGGISLYDPRKDTSVGGLGSHRWADPSTWEVSENLGVQAYNILRGIDLGGGEVWGGNVAASDLPLANWWAAMNNADQAITLAAGGSEAQYRSSYEVFVDDEPASVLEELLKAGSGALAENGGVWKIRLGGPGLPVFFFDDDDVIVSESEDSSPFSASNAAYNGIQVVYPDPDTNWEPRDAPARYNDEYETADAGQRRVADLTISACPYPDQIQRVMRAYIEEERRFRVHTLSLPPEAMVLEALDVVGWTSERHGYAAKVFEVTSNVDPLTTAIPRIALRERDPSDYSWSSTYELPSAVPSSEFDPIDAQTVPSFAVAAVAIEDADGNNARPAIRAIWDGAQEDVRGIEFEVEASDGTSIVRVSSLNVAVGEYVIAEGILPDKDYRVRAQFIVDRPTAWTSYFSVTTLDLRIRPDDLDTPSFQTTGLALFGGTLQSDDFVTGVSGWQINQNGSMELQDLVARDWIKAGAVSDGVEVNLPGPGTNLNNVIWVDNIGPMRRDQLWHFSFIGEWRGPGFEYEGQRTTGGGGDLVYDYKTYSTRLILEYRGQSGGSWGGWITVATTGYRDANSYGTTKKVEHIIGDYDDAQVRVRAETTFINETSSADPRPDNYPRDNWQNFGIAVKSVVV